MKNIPVHELVVGDVFAKEIKLHGSVAYEVIERPEGKNYLIVKRRGEVNPQNFHMKDSMNVYWLRNTL